MHLTELKHFHHDVKHRLRSERHTIEQMKILQGYHLNIDYRVLMTNDKQWRWTNIMCALVKDLKDKNYETRHPASKGSLYKEENGEVIAHGTFAYLMDNDIQ